MMTQTIRVTGQNGKEEKQLHTAFAGFSALLLRRMSVGNPNLMFEKGSVLFQAGDRDVDMYVVLSGRLEVYDQQVSGLEQPVAILARGQFTGELDLLDNRPALVNCRAKTRAKVLCVTRTALRQLMKSDAEIGEIIMQACIGRRFDLVRHASGGVTLVGQEHSGNTIRLKRFLTRNALPFQQVNATPELQAALFAHDGHLDNLDEPAIVLSDGRVLRNPSNSELADHLQLIDRRDLGMVYDVAIVGAGPAGLASAVYAASEGLSTAVIEGAAPGGQAGTSSRIENYLGFPTGISGQELSERSLIQAQKFGTHFMISRDAVSVRHENHVYSVMLSDGDSLQARAIIIATGAKYQKLNVPNYDRFEYQGIHYAATAMEADLCRGQEVPVVGAGNSAGQAALFLSRTAKHVYLLVRGKSLEATMSDYLIQRIVASERISVLISTEIVGLEGKGHLLQVSWRVGAAKLDSKRMENIFVMIGARPRTEWLCNLVATDAKGFILTGANAGRQSSFSTSMDGIFAVGDVRSGSVKRVASAVGEGSVVISDVHQYLAQPAIITVPVANPAALVHRGEGLRSDLVTSGQ
jgi:thioredoxin reductase (NADPH)